MADHRLPVTRLRALIERAESGDEGALAELRAELGGSEAVRSAVMRVLPSALERWVVRRARGSPVAELATRAIVDRLRADLLPCDEEPSGLVTMLANRVLVCWLALECAELGYLEGTEGEHGRQAEVFWLGRVDGCQKRLLAAVRALALARKMAAPDVWRVLPSGRVPGEPEV